ncbi:MAG: DbpA RNA binding domain-containing protein, partial [Deltaproteobacteria bacterium]|nr:DbpA RNA binding domain-containing protein [Deltaproteobacteria bacterium]
RDGRARVCIATDVAARGIDLPGLELVIHADLPRNRDTLLHRSGRTGRAGRKGTSSILVTPPALNRVTFLLKRARVRWRFEPVPSAEEIAGAHDDAMFHQLTEKESSSEADDRAWALAKRIVATGEGTRAIARLLGRARQEGPEPRPVKPVQPPRPKEKRAERHDDRREPRHDDRREPRHDDKREPRHDDRREPRHDDKRKPPIDRPSPPPAAEAQRDATRDGTWVPFRVTWGQVHGADARRLVAMLCRRGGIRGSDIGAIRVSRVHSVVEVAGSVAQAFERATSEPDPRDPRVRIRRDEGGPPDAPPPPRDRHGHGPPLRQRPHGPPRAHKGKKR